MLWSFIMYIELRMENTIRISMMCTDFALVCSLESSLVLQSVESNLVISSQIVLFLF